MSEIADWFKALPLFTRYWFGLSIVFPILGRFKIISAYHMLLDYELVFKHFQLWRPISSVFFYPMGFHYLINLYFLYSYSVRLESGAYAGKPAEYCFMLLFNWMCILLIALVCEIQLLMDPMVLSVLYIWCQLNKDQIVQFWFATRFKAAFLPWVLFGFNMIVSGGGLYELIGILVGHIYFFLTFQYPQEGGRQILTVPSILYKYFPNQTGGFGGFGTAPQPRQPSRSNNNNSSNTSNGQQQGGSGWFGHNWGSGQTLGGQ